MINGLSVRAVGAFVLVGTLACGREPVGPVASLDETPAVAGQIVLDDGAGGSLALDPSSGIVTNAEGQRVRLSAEALETVLTAEEAAKEMVYLMEGYLGYVPGPDSCTWDGSGIPCAESWGAAAGRGRAGVPVVHGFPMAEVSPGRDAQGRFITRGYPRGLRRLGPWRNDLPTQGEIPVLGEEVGSAPAFVASWDCAQLAQALWGVREAMRANGRAHVVGLADDMRQIIIAAAGIPVVGGLPTVTGVTAGIETGAAEVLKLYVQVKLLTGLMYGLDCQGRTFYGGYTGAGDYQPDPDRPPVGQWRRYCGLMLWRFRRADGTLAEQTIETCIVQLELFK